MKNGQARFDFFLLQLEDHLAKAAKEDNPGLWMYTNNTRTPMFMLEGLAKLYSNLHNNSLFSKLKDRFKEVEDAIGQVDYYDCFVKQFSKNEEIPGLIIAYLQRKKEEKVAALNDLLIEKKWIGKKANRLEKIRKKLDEADWRKDKEEIEAIRNFYHEAVTQINVFYRDTNGTFTDIENQVHALRRKLRWLSIYPQALRGCIQLTDSKVPDENVGRYLQPEIINSPFNKMPDAGNNRYFLLLEKNYFLALSWMIAELGKLKDAGLGIIAVNEAVAYHKDHLPGSMDAIYKAAASGETIESIFSRSQAICKAYFDEKNLEKMVGGISAVV